MVTRRTSFAASQVRPSVLFRSWYLQAPPPPGDGQVSPLLLLLVKEQQRKWLLSWAS